MAVARRTAQQADFTFEVGPYTPEDLRVVQYAGSEGISQLFEFEIEIASDDPALDFAQVVGKPAVLTVYHDDGERHVAGVVRAFEQGASGVQFSRYQAYLVPSVWMLTQRAQSRIFQDLTTQEIVQQVLTGGGIAADRIRFSLDRTYQPRNYCVQYRENDWSFVARLLEEEGIFFFFEHAADGDTIVMSDSAVVHVPIPGKAEVVYREPGGMVATEEHVALFRYSENVRPGKAVLRDFAFKNPGLGLEATAQGDKDKALEVYDYPGEYVKSDLGNVLAKVRLGELQATRRQGGGEATCRRFVPGACFTLAEHPRSDLNAEWILLRVHHRGNQRESLGEEPEAGGEREPVYWNEFECIPSKVTYHPPRVTPRPIVTGAQTALVVGPSGEEIHCDEHGRIKIHFHWDRDGEMDDKASCWVRVAQPWAGAGWGFLSLPRVGQEVMVDFIEGDPDRPIVTGSVYNADQKPPYKLPDEKTKSTWKSYSSKGGGGFNEIRYEDKKGDEQVFIHAQKDLDMRIRSDRREWVGHDRHLIVKRDRVEEVGRDAHVVVKRDHVEKIGRDRFLSIDGKEAVRISSSKSLEVQGDRIDEIGGNHSEKVTGNVYVSGMNVVVEGMTGVTLKVGGNFVTINPTGVMIQGTLVMINSGGAPGVGMAGSLVSPTDPLEAEAADDADPGNMKTYKAQRAARTPEQQALAAAPSHDPTSEEAQKKKSWIEVELVDEEGKPVPGERYRVTLPDGTTLAEGTLDQNGFARVDNIDPGTCKITFPRLDKNAWERG